LSQITLNSKNTCDFAKFIISLQPLWLLVRDVKKEKNVLAAIHYFTI
jgi:hypothetical protein